MAKKHKESKWKRRRKSDNRLIEVTRTGTKGNRKYNEKVVPPKEKKNVKKKRIGRKQEQSKMQRGGGKSNKNSNSTRTSGEKRLLRICPMCEKEVKIRTTKDRDIIGRGRMVPLYKVFNGEFYHNSKTKRCWEKYYRSMHKPTAIEAGGEISTSPKAYIKGKREY